MFYSNSQEKIFGLVFCWHVLLLKPMRLKKHFKKARKHLREGTQHTVFLCFISCCAAIQYGTYVKSERGRMCALAPCWRGV